MWIVDWVVCATGANAWVVSAAHVYDEWRAARAMVAPPCGLPGNRWNVLPVCAYCSTHLDPSQSASNIVCELRAMNTLLLLP